MVNIQLQSQMFYGDADALRDFFFVHRLVHIGIDAAVSRAGLGSLPNATLDSERALAAWVSVMRKDQQADEGGQYALLDWLQLHANLHQAEYSALGLGVGPDLGVVDFSQESEFYDWMYSHAAAHDTLGDATGTNQ